MHYVSLHAQLNHQQEVGYDHGGEQEKENCEWPGRSQSQDRTLSTVKAAHKDAMYLTYLHILTRVPDTDLVLFITPCQTNLTSDCSRSVFIFLILFYFILLTFTILFSY